MNTGIKKKNIRDVEIGDHVRQTTSNSGKKEMWGSSDDSTG